MYSILLADDEPAFCHHIELLLQKYNTDFFIKEKVLNGELAFEKAISSDFDLIITDIRMPVMDGLELAKALRKKDILTPIILVSGYADFSYAQSAIRLGVVDYLLKPVIAEEFLTLLANTHAQLKESTHEKRKTFIHSLVADKTFISNKACEFFPAQSYYVVLIRKNIPFYSVSGISPKELFSDYTEQFFLYGRDEHEALYLFPDTLIGNDWDDFRIKILSNFKKSQPETETAYYTMVFLSHSVSPADFSRIFHQIYKILDYNICFLKNSCISLSSYEDFSARNAVASAQKDFNLFEGYCQKKEIAGLKQELNRLIYLWCTSGCPILDIKKRILHLIHLLRKYQIAIFTETANEDTMILNAFLGANSIFQLQSNIDEFLFANCNANSAFSSQKKMNSYEYYQLVIDYLKTHFNETITLTSICHTLGISQTHLNRLLNKYGNTSFSDCLTNIRMDYAKHLLTTSADNVMIRDIAEQCGYKDSFYFSRLFRSYVGVSPSDFKNVPVQSTQATIS